MVGIMFMTSFRGFTLRSSIRTYVDYLRAGTRDRYVGLLHARALRRCCLLHPTAAADSRLSLIVVTNGCSGSVALHLQYRIPRESPNSCEAASTLAVARAHRDCLSCRPFGRSDWSAPSYRLPRTSCTVFTGCCRCCWCRSRSAPSSCTTRCWSSSSTWWRSFWSGGRACCASSCLSWRWSSCATVASASASSATGAPPTLSLRRARASRI